MNRTTYCAIALLVLGCLQMMGNLIGFVPLKAIGAASMASPAPKVFCTQEGLETFSTKFVVVYQDLDGQEHRKEVTPEVSAGLKGPYNRRNVYGAILSYGPVLRDNPVTKPMYESVASRAFCGSDAPLLVELGIDPKLVRQGSIRAELTLRPDESGFQKKEVLVPSCST